MLYNNSNILKKRLIINYNNIIRYYNTNNNNSMPPWRKWSSKLPNMGSSLHLLTNSKGPVMVSPSRVRIAIGDDNPIDMEDYTLAVIQTIPFAYKYHHPLNRSKRIADDNILNKISNKVKERLPDLTDNQIIKILLSFDKIRPRVINRTAHPGRYFLSRPLAYINQAFITTLYQAINPLSINNIKVMLALFRAYTRSGIDHPEWIRCIMDNACNTWLLNDIENNNITTRQLADIALVLSSIRIKKIQYEHFLQLLIDEIEDNFDQFDEDSIGDIVRSFINIKYGNEQLFKIFARELPHRIHEYKWWNLIDIAELYMILKWPADNDPDMILRFGNEVWKYHKLMNGKYVARALRVLAYLETSDRRTFRSLIRRIPHHIMHLTPRLLAQSITAAAMIGYDPNKMYCRIKGSLLHERLCRRLSRKLYEVTPHDLAQAVYSLMMVNSRQEYLFENIVLCVIDDPLRFHLQQLSAFARAFKKLNYIPSVDILSIYGDKTQLSGCSIDAIATVAALGNDELQIAALELLINGYVPWKKNDIKQCVIDECNCEDILWILRGIKNINNNKIIINDVINSIYKYWLPAHYNNITAEELSWLLWDITSIKVTTTNDTLSYESKEKEEQEEEVEDDDDDDANNDYGLLMIKLINRLIDNFTTEQSIRVLSCIIICNNKSQQLFNKNKNDDYDYCWIYNTLLPRITNSILPSDNQSTSIILIQLINMYLRLSTFNNNIPIEVVEFCKWVDNITANQLKEYFINANNIQSIDDNLLLSSSSSIFNGLDWSIPSINGCIRNLICYPFILPLALINTSIIVDIQKLQRSRTFLEVRRLLLSHNNSNNNCGICIIPNTMVPQDVIGYLTLDILNRLGWDVKIIDDPNKVINIDILNQLFNTSIQQKQKEEGQNE